MSQGESAAEEVEEAGLGIELRSTRAKRVSKT